MAYSSLILLRHTMIYMSVEYLDQPDYRILSILLVIDHCIVPYIEVLLYN